MSPYSAWMTEDETLISETVRSFFEEKVAPNEIDLENSGLVDSCLLKWLGGLDHLGVGVPNKYSDLGAEGAGKRRIDALNSIEQGHVSTLGWGSILQRNVKSYVGLT